MDGIHFYLMICKDIYVTDNILQWRGCQSIQDKAMKSSRMKLFSLPNFIIGILLGF